MTAYRVAEAEIPMRVSVVTSVPRMEATTFDDDFRNGLDAAQGIFVGLLLCVPFWVGVYLLIF